jgi:hypothetical protein
MQVAGVLGHDFLHELQGAQFCGVASRRTEPTGLHFLLPMGQWALRGLLVHGCQFPWIFRVMVAGCVVGGAWSSESYVCQEVRTYHQGSAK